MSPRKLKLKNVSYRLIDPQTEDGAPMYARLTEILETHHEELLQHHARIALAWATAWKADVDGRLVLGKCKKASDLDRELAPFDFVILLNREFWQDPRVSDEARTALLDHELMHAAVAYDENGHAKEDVRGRSVFRIRKHDIEEFADIVKRHGCYKHDLEAFARALWRAERGLGEWIGYSTLRDALAAIDVNVDLGVIRTWPLEERKRVMAWASVRRAAGTSGAVSFAMSDEVPPVVAAALGLLAEPAAAAAH
jgi:hypothetical protein